MGVKRVKTGWQADWYDEAGRRERETLPSSVEAHAFHKAQVAEVQRRKALGLGPRKRFRDFAAEWLVDIKAEAEGRKKPKTYRWYEMMVRVHLNPIYGDNYLSDMTPGILRGNATHPGIKKALLAKPRAGRPGKTISTSTVAGACTCLGTILRAAYKREHTVRDLSAFIEKPKVIRDLENKRPLTHEELSAFFKVCPDQHRLFYGICFFTGMRHGEALALRFGDIDLRNSKIHIERSLSEDEISTPKTGQGRVIDITPHLRPFFTSWRHLKDPQGDLIFPGYDLSNMRSRVWKKLLRQIGSAYRKPYVTRHTFAALMLSEGQPAAWVANVMGDTLETVLREYHQYIPTSYKVDLMRPIDTGGRFLDTVGAPQGGGKESLMDAVGYGATGRDRTGDLLITNHTKHENSDSPKDLSLSQFSHKPPKQKGNA